MNDRRILEAGGPTRVRGLVPRTVALMGGSMSPGPVNTSVVALAALGVPESPGCGGRRPPRRECERDCACQVNVSSGSSARSRSSRQRAAARRRRAPASQAPGASAPPGLGSLPDPLRPPGRVRISPTSRSFASYLASEDPHSLDPASRGRRRTDIAVLHALNRGLAVLRPGAEHRSGARGGHARGLAQTA